MAATALRMGSAEEQDIDSAADVEKTVELWNDGPSS